MLTTFLRPAGDYTSNYWFHGGMATGGYSIHARDVAIRSDGDIVVAGYQDGFALPSATLWGLSPKGRLLWIYKGDTSGSLSAIGLDGSNNIFVTGADGTLNTAIQKWAGDGSSISWQTNYQTSNGSSHGAIDSSANLYVGGDELSGSYTYGVTAKFNSSGTLQWDRKLGDGVNSVGHKAVCVDGSGNVFAVGDYSGGFAVATLVKYNSSGTIQWQRKLSETSVNVSLSDCAADSSGNLYAAGGTTVVKYNSSGTLQWQKKLSGGSFNRVTISSDDRIFLSGSRSGGTGTSDGLLLEINSSGSIIWQTMFGRASKTCGAYGVALDGLSLTVALVGTAGGVLRVPADGSKTGTYGNYTYATSSLTFSTNTHTSATTTYTDSAVTITETTTAYSPSALSPTEDRTVFRP